MTITTEEIAQLRKLAAHLSTFGDWSSANMKLAAQKALPRLLDEIERLRDTPKLTASSEAFLDAVSIATSGRSYPNCNLASKAASKITDTAHLRCAEAVIKLGRDWIDQSYEIERLHAYDRALSAVMPADFKDWHQNHPREWPEVAAHVVSNMRQREEDACAEIERLRADLREAMALLRDVDEFANPVGSWQRRDALLAKHKEDA